MIKLVLFYIVAKKSPANIGKDLNCVLNSKEIVEPFVKLKIKEAKRKKRDDDGFTTGGQKPGAGGQANGAGVKQNGAKKNTQKQPQYGCPPKYERVMENICLRYGKVKDDKEKETKTDLVSNFMTAEAFCKDDEAKLLYFSDSEEILTIREWLGKIRSYL